MLFRTRYNVLFRQFRLLTAQAGSIPAAIRLIFENCYKRIFCASPIYGSAEDFTSSLNFTPCKGVTPAAKQQIGETRKKAQQRRPPPAADTGRSCWGRGQQDTSAAQGTKWTLGIATRLSAAASFFPFRPLLWGLKGASSPFLVPPAPRK